MYLQFYNVFLEFIWCYILECNCDLQIVVDYIASLKIGLSLCFHTILNIGWF